MPMQPRPRAETRGPVRPRGRVSMGEGVRVDGEAGERSYICQYMSLKVRTRVERALWGAHSEARTERRHGGRRRRTGGWGGHRRHAAVPARRTRRRRAAVTCALVSARPTVRARLVRARAAPPALFAARRSATFAARRHSPWRAASAARDATRWRATTYRANPRRSPRGPGPALPTP